MSHDYWRAIAVAGLALVLSGAACQKERTWDDPGPEATFRQYLMHWFHGEREQAFAMIDPDDRERLTQPLEVLRERLDDEELPREHEMLIASRTDNPYDIRSMETSPTLDARPESGTTVTLELEYHDQRTGRARVVWREGRWYVDLPMASSSSRSPDDGSSTSAGVSSDSAPSADAGSSDDTGLAPPSTTDVEAR